MKATAYPQDWVLPLLIENSLARYYPNVQDALTKVDLESTLPGQEGFSPGTELPELTPAVMAFLAPSELSFAPMADYRGHQLALLDLTRNPATRTTKTLASAVIVLRAVKYIQSTGERVTIITPSSANKATALRDAVLRAIQCGLAQPHELNIVVVVPSSASYKLRHSELLSDQELRRRNPIVGYSKGPADEVKTIAQRAAAEYRGEIETSAKTNLWYTLSLGNYLSADIARAYAENEFFPPAPGKTRWHAHAVSSAYGLLGHAFGEQLIHGPDGPPKPGYFLVQHLGAPNMVADLYRNDSAAETQGPPKYSYDHATGLYRQDENAHFPQVTFDPEEILDPTFYTRNPPTRTRMSSLIHTQGGGGIVVSLAECLERYGQVRALLEGAGLPIPGNPTRLLEWSTVMALTGVLHGIDRGIIKADEVILHGSGAYARGDFAPVGQHDIHAVEDGHALRDLIVHASKP